MLLAFPVVSVNDIVAVVVALLDTDEPIAVVKPAFVYAWKVTYCSLIAVNGIDTAPDDVVEDAVPTVNVATALSVIYTYRVAVSV